jgi:hypothetical protein
LMLKTLSLNTFEIPCHGRSCLDDKIDIILLFVLNEFF